MTTIRRLRPSGLAIPSLLAIQASVLLLALAGNVSHARSATLTVDTTEFHGTFEGVDYTRYVGRFIGTADALPYATLSGAEGAEFDVLYSLVMPPPDRWNGLIHVELVHPAGGAEDGRAGEFVRLANETSLFGHAIVDSDPTHRHLAPARGPAVGPRDGDRVGYASVAWEGHTKDDWIDLPYGFTRDVPAAAPEIVNRFGVALRRGYPAELLGDAGSHGRPRHLTVMGVSRTGVGARGVLAQRNLLGPVFDVGVIFLAGAAYYGIDPVDSEAPEIAVIREGALELGNQRVLQLDTEGDILPLPLQAYPEDIRDVAALVLPDNSDGTGFFLRDGAFQVGQLGEADDRRRFLYHVRGAAHFNDLNATPTPLVFASLFGRGVLRQAHQWLLTGTPPEESAPMTFDAAAGVDPVYGYVTGRALDDDGNGMGGLDTPEMLIMRAKALGVTDVFFTAMRALVGFYIKLFTTGVWDEDLLDVFYQNASALDFGEATPLPHGLDRDAYVAEATRIADDLVRRRFLLPQDRDAYLAYHATRPLD